MVLGFYLTGLFRKHSISGIAVALICSFMGTFLVLRRYSLFGDGIAPCFIWRSSSRIILRIVSYLDCVYLGNIWRHWTTKTSTECKDFRRCSNSCCFSFRIVCRSIFLVSSSGGFSVDLFSFLFGSILLISNEDTMIILTISTGIIATLVALRKQFLQITFNEEQAKISGLSVTLLNYAFVILASVTVVTSMRLVGILLISALIVIPNISAMMFGKGFKQTVGISMLISTASVITGILLSYYYNLAPSGIIVIVAVSILVGVLLARSAGIIRKVDIKKKSEITRMTTNTDFKLEK